jgi:hypothetical protein
MRKYEIALLLGRRYGYTSYLEICTPTAGHTFSLIDKEQFPRRTRLMYRCPPDFSDGERIDFSTEAESGEELFAELVRSGERFDLVFVDALHTYKSSLRDIVFGLHLVKKGGLLLVHDCNPPDRTFAGPEYQSGGWCGVTFAAYLDVVLFTGGIDYVTVDTDYGCGIISKDDRLADFAGSRPDATLASLWRMLDLSQKYSFFDEIRSRLLRLISIDEFCARVGGDSPTVAERKTGSEGDGAGRARDRARRAWGLIRRLVDWRVDF